MVLGREDLPVMICDLCSAGLLGIFFCLSCFLHNFTGLRGITICVFNKGM